MTAVRKLWELFERYDKEMERTLREQREAAALRRSIVKEYIDHADEDRPE